jgi:Plasmid pRiA4b ORF-3-like protein
MSAGDQPQSETIATLRIDLIDSDPPIWREIEVPVAMTLKQLHAVVQAAMAWQDAHLWEFALGRERIGSSRAARLTVQELLRPRVTRLGYTYDMGDCW